VRGTYRAEVAILAVAFAVFGLVVLALVWSGDWAYAWLANLNGVRTVEFVRTGSTSLDTLLSYHRAWSDYVTGRSSFMAANMGPVPIVFTADEIAHMDDVRKVFIGAQIAAVVALGIAGFRVLRARVQGYSLWLVRDGALAAAGLVTLIGLAAVVAFDQLFLLFHQVFFSQGNFLFDPATSNLIRLYPEWYWQGITAGVGVSFIAVGILVAGAAHIALGRASNTYTRAA
jgi:integral membrane protein (TIGR01906 family)